MCCEAHRVLREIIHRCNLYDEWSSLYIVSSGDFEISNFENIVRVHVLNFQAMYAIKINNPQCAAKSFVLFTVRD